MSEDYNAGFQAARSHAVALVQEVLTTHQHVPYETAEITSLLLGLLRQLPLEAPAECENCGRPLYDDGTCPNNNGINACGGDHD